MKSMWIFVLCFVCSFCYCGEVKEEVKEVKEEKKNIVLTVEDLKKIADEVYKIEKNSNFSKEDKEKKISELLGKEKGKTVSISCNEYDNSCNNGRWTCNRYYKVLKQIKYGSAKKNEIKKANKLKKIIDPSYKISVFLGGFHKKEYNIEKSITKKDNIKLDITGTIDVIKSGYNEKEHCKYIGIIILRDADVKINKLNRG